MQKVLPFVIENTNIDKLLATCAIRGATINHIPVIEKIDDKTSKVNSFHTCNDVCKVICEILDIEILDIELLVEKVIYPHPKEHNKFTIPTSMDDTYQI